MADGTLLSTWYTVEGATKQLMIEAVERDLVDIDGATASITIYDSNGAAVLGPSAMTGAQLPTPTTGKRRFYIPIPAGPTKDLPEAGDYDAEILVTFGDYVEPCTVPIVVQPAPR